MSDATIRAYCRHRDEIARQHGLTKLVKINQDGWSTVDKTISTDLRDDSDGILLLEKFSRQAEKFKGGCYADDGESIGLWHQPAKCVRTMMRTAAESIHTSIGTKALFHPGYLPVGRHPWPTLRIENPNPSPYSSDVEWLWLIAYKPDLDASMFPDYDFFVGEARKDGSRFGIDACVRPYEANCTSHTTETRWVNGQQKEKQCTYTPEHPYITTQARLNRLITDASAYVEKLRRVRTSYEQAGLQDTSYLDADLGVRSKQVRRLWKLD